MEKSRLIKRRVDRLVELHEFHRGSVREKILVVGDIEKLRLYLRILIDVLPVDQNGSLVRF